MHIHTEHGDVIMVQTQLNVVQWSMAYVQLAVVASVFTAGSADVVKKVGRIRFVYNIITGF